MHASLITDFDLDFLRCAVDLVDGRLDLLDGTASASEDPDSFGVLDEINYVTGFGFMACQTYLAATIGRSRVAKSNALEVRPVHRTGRPIAALVNACANYWKHSEEWGRKVPARAKKTVEAVSSLGVDPDQPYAMANALSEMLAPHSPRFAKIVPFLEHWRELLRERDR